MRFSVSVFAVHAIRDRLLIGVTGDPLSPAYYVILTSLVSLIAMCRMPGTFTPSERAAARRAERPPDSRDRPHFHAADGASRSSALQLTRSASD